MSNENRVGKRMKEPQTPIGRRLRTLRLERGWSQEKLAEVSDLTRDTIARIERGCHHTPRLITIELLADALGVSPDYLTTGRGNPNKTP